MLCANCGKETTENDSYCEHCGFPLADNSSTKKCPFCREIVKLDAIKCKHCKSDLPISDVRVETIETLPSPGDIICIEALKSPNTPCLWVSLDYWNLYLQNNKIFALRCYRGKWGAIGFIIGLFLAFVGFIVVGGLGLLLDKSTGEARCRTMSKKFSEITNTNKNMLMVSFPENTVPATDASDLCLGNLWLRYKIQIGERKFYFEQSRYEEILKKLNID